VSRSLPSNPLEASLREFGSAEPGECPDGSRSYLVPVSRSVPSNPLETSFRGFGSAEPDESPDGSQSYDKLTAKLCRCDTRWHGCTFRQLFTRGSILIHGQRLVDLPWRRTVPGDGGLVFGCDVDLLCQCMLRWSFTRRPNFFIVEYWESSRNLVEVRGRESYRWNPFTAVYTLYQGSQGSHFHCQRFACDFDDLPNIVTVYKAMSTKSPGCTESTHATFNFSSRSGSSVQKQSRMPCYLRLFPYRCIILFLSSQFSNRNKPLIKKDEKLTRL
jgi:hypothetical protein